MAAESSASIASFYKPVRVLPLEVARKIAAGEVIDRPAAVIRELIDNSIDAGSTKITVEIEGGGIERIRITDNGCGMTAEDLAICTNTHTTSKIASEDDLLSLTTLGFRGEALSSIHAVSRLEITTTRDGREAWKLEAGHIVPSRLSVGTIVSIEGLFENFPARRQFLKRPSAETTLCKQIFTEKALAWPEIEFRFSVDGKQGDILPRVSTLRERCLACLAPRESESFFYGIAGDGSGFTFSAILGSPDVVRADRRQLMVFVNGRRIMDYSLLQAMEYGAEGHFPNGGHPFGFLFVTIDPSLVDFNIHPAKREARFRDQSALHHAVSSTIRDFYRRYTIAEMKRDSRFFNGASDGDRSDNNRIDNSRADLDLFENGRPSNSMSESKSPGFHFLPTGTPDTRYTSAASQDVRYTDIPHSDIPQSFRFLGQVLGTFLAVEKGNLFYLIDQHAAHERILYDELMSHSKEKQELLVPYRIETQSEAENAHLVRIREKLKDAGFILVDEGEGIWQITAVPVRWNGTRKDITEEILDMSKESEALVSHMYATAACRAACKDGDVLDSVTARNLVEKAFMLDEPVCPHGRPIWILMDRKELFNRIRRT